MLARVSMKGNQEMCQKEREEQREEINEMDNWKMNLNLIGLWWAALSLSFSQNSKNQSR